MLNLVMEEQMPTRKVGDTAVLMQLMVVMVARPRKQAGIIHLVVLVLVDTQVLVAVVCIMARLHLLEVAVVPVVVHTGEWAAAVVASVFMVTDSLVEVEQTQWFTSLH
jgi:hypothetical protein